MRRLLAAPVLLSLVCSLAAPARAATPRSFDSRSFRGLGTWVDGYDFSRELTTRPTVTAASVATMKRRGVTTIWLQAAKTSPKVRGAMLSPDRVGAILRTAHSYGIRVVAWYLPTFAHPTVDKRKVTALVGFSTGGQHFDGIALDIEDNRVAVGARNARLVTLSRQLRAMTSRPVAAVVMPPVITDIISPGYWHGSFPWRALKSSFDVWVPMGYYTVYTRWPRWRNASASTTEDIRRVRAHLAARVPVAYAGGLAADSTRTDYVGFARAARAAGALGTSAYDYATTPAWAWNYLRAGAP